MHSLVFGRKFHFRNIVPNDFGNTEGTGHQLVLWTKVKKNIMAARLSLRHSMGKVGPISFIAALSR
jgi:hypothetical protein